MNIRPLLAIEQDKHVLEKSALVQLMASILKPIEPDLKWSHFAKNMIANRKNSNKH